MPGPVESSKSMITFINWIHGGCSWDKTMEPQAEVSGFNSHSGLCVDFSAFLLPKTKIWDCEEYQASTVI
jgi:hypothetical protein